MRKYFSPVRVIMYVLIAFAVAYPMIRVMGVIGTASALTPEQAKLLSVGDKVRVSLEWGTGPQKIVYLQGEGNVTAYNPTTGVATMRLVDTSEKHKGDIVEAGLHYMWITDILEDVKDPVSDDIIVLNEKIKALEAINSTLTAENTGLKAFKAQATADMINVNKVSSNYLPR